ncbi:MAG: putative ABC transporter ATP-binding protein [Candidatus Methanofastidiosum methylothiophilum]|jgi:energy-coupling factor transport system ATP-binding protein|uniref:Putative ABC transporter ATP-binding protein n=1 Tax=Candidatus Methanofastidiosum methylothiophilum TaxID=1705564 RepID=A0A150INX1_9EURY|nr:MAG: putative ABC transporter ATP-binding protein [Candidatus Methanofastidiosum methylthiophilus]
MIEIKDLHFKYHSQKEEVLNGINLNIKKGEFVSIIGPSGCGKSTLCLTLNGIIPKTITGEFSGDVFIDGISTREKEVSEFSKKVGMILQNPESQLFAMTVEEELAFGPENLAVPRDEIEERISWALSIVNMENKRDEFPGNLSGGQKQRIAIAASLTMMPEVLVLDEPTSQLDPVGKREVFRVLRDLHKNEKMTIVLVEHKTEPIAELSDRVVVMDKGKVVLEGTPRHVFEKVPILRELGIMVPDISYLTYLLKEGGYVKDIALTIEEGRRLFI